MTAAANAREAILNSVRSALRRGPLDDARRAELDARRPQHTRPAQDEELVARFIRKFESRAGTTARVASRADVPAAVEAYRADKGLPARAAVGAALNDLAFASLETHHAPAGIDEAMAVSQALCGIAEPGSLMMASGPASPITHNFVPDDHIVVLDANAIVGHFEEAWDILRARPEGMPRATNIISGPSRTADVEQTIQLGAHGPRRVHVIIVG
ncbi:LutC/YkgG family protein [Aromatoleum evansii]|uniref:LUD domain-containing protein n=1 Tax=Aromatoleum evansii TaxID=59406 RepID=A0ABZ1AMC6_AROEV|nr:LUD domain-containing protein [Aromatoleum evansii]NMG30121.1 lactate utilization protein C [Aromatoleum evansii]WRL47011.1 LUD domain-containing protein [Aromatoleum evansii]